MKSLKITIPNPCSQDWNKMTPQSVGRHCGSCDIVVRDFSTLSDSQILHIIQQSDGGMCGHFRSDQLNRSLMIERVRRSPDLLAVVLGMALLLSAYPSHSSPMMDTNPPISLIEMLNSGEELTADGHEYIEMKFRLIDAETDEVIPFLSVSLHNESGVLLAGAISDIDGMLTFKLSPDQKAAVSYLDIRSFDYAEKTIQWDKSWKAGSIKELELNQEHYLIDGLMIIEPEEKD
ncbi:MAG: hypothetical protein Crog4KO_15030 [Crocinitomicaceae bacterium]